MYKRYEGKRDFEQRSNGKITEMFLLGTEYFVCRKEVESAIRVLNDMLRNIGWQMESMDERKDWRGWYSEECTRGKEMVMKKLNNWTRQKTCENRYELVENKRQYKKITDKEKKEQQDRNADNIKRLLKKKDTQQLWSSIRMMTQVRKQMDGVDPVRAREYFKGLLGKGFRERVGTKDRK
jgi:hypothetical protein